MWLFLGGISLNPQGDGEKPTFNSLGCQDYVMPDCLELKVVNDRGEVIWAVFRWGWWMVMGPGWEKWWEKCIICHIETHMNGWFVDSYGIIVGKYMPFPDGSILKVSFSHYRKWCASRSWSCSMGMFFFFFGGGGFLVIHWNQPTHLWGVAWLTCLWSPLVCITRCFLFKERSMRPHFCLQLFKHETCIDTGVPMIQLWLTAWLINWVAPKNSPPPRKHNECSPELRDPFKKTKLVFRGFFATFFPGVHSSWISQDFALQFFDWSTSRV